MGPDDAADARERHSNMMNSSVVALIMLLCCCEPPVPDRIPDAAPVAPRRAAPLTRIGEFDLAAPSYDLAKLYPRGQITIDEALIAIQGNEASYIYAFIEIDLDTNNVVSLAADHVRTFDAFETEHPGTKCAKDEEEEGFTTCVPPEQPEVMYWGRDAIEKVLWQPTDRHTVIIDAELPKRYPDALRARCTRILTRALGCGYIYSPQLGYLTKVKPRAARDEFDPCDVTMLEWTASMEADVAVAVDVAARGGCKMLRSELRSRRLAD